MLFISEINIYPVKSLRGVTLKSAFVSDRGFEYDRRWMLVDHKGNFMTQREYPQMAFINVEIKNDGLSVYHRKKNIPHLFIPFKIKAARAVTVPIWNDTCTAYLLGREFDNWFKDALGVDCCIVYQPDETQRYVDEKYSNDKEIVSFADGFPFLMIGQSSLDDLNLRLDSPLPMNRFRPNIVFTGGEPFEEDNMKKFKIGNIFFYGIKPCSRCVITTTNQETAEKSPEPLKTLAEYRKFNNKVLFGMNLIHKGCGKIKIGDYIEIIESAGT